MVKNEDVLKIACNEITNLKVSLQKQQHSLLLTRQFSKKRAKASRSTKSCSGKTARWTKPQLTIFIKTTNISIVLRHFTRARIKFRDELKNGENIHTQNVLKNQSKKKKMKKHPSLFRQRYLLSKEGNTELFVE